MHMDQYSMQAPILHFLSDEFDGRLISSMP